MSSRAGATAHPITNAERIRWQRDAAGILARLLDLAAKRGLPAIRWSVSYAGARLGGECLALHSDLRRAQFAAWREALGEPDTEREDVPGDGTVRLVAVWDRAGPAWKGLRPLLSDRDGYQRAGVVLTATILPDLDDEDGATGEVATYAAMLEAPDPDPGRRAALRSELARLATERQCWEEAARACTCPPARCARNGFRDHQGDSPGCVVCADLDPGQPCYAAVIARLAAWGEAADPGARVPLESGGLRQARAYLDQAGGGEPETRQ